MLEYDLTYLDGARKFESAATGYQDIAGMNASIGMLMEIGAEQVEEHISALAWRLMEGIAMLPSLALVTPREPARHAGIVSFLVADSQTASERLDSAGVIHSVRGGGVIRLAPHIYNTVDEIDRMLAVLGSLGTAGTAGTAW